LWSKLSVVISLYGRLESFNGATTEDYPLGSLLYAESVLRQTKLALAVWVSEGWNVKALEILVRGVGTKLPNFSRTARLILNEKSGLSCSQIAGILCQAHGPFILHLGSYDRLKVLSAQASIYGVLGLHRKEAFISREILGVLLDLLSLSRSKDHQENYGDSTSPTSDQPSTGWRKGESDDGNDSIVRLIYRIGEAYGLKLDYFPIIDAQSPEPSNSCKLTSTEKFSSGWGELQLYLVREVIAITETLPGSNFIIPHIKILVDDDVE
jgi:trafficking protein particle complex subunit 9